MQPAAAPAARRRPCSRAQTALTYLTYGGVAVLVVLALALPRPAPDGPRPVSRREWLEKSLAAKRRGVLSQPCRLLLDAFAEAFADFMSCSLKSARPLQVCLKCVTNRYALEAAYYNIRYGTGDADDECHYELMDQDDVQVVAFHIRYYERIMALNRCDLCMRRQPYGGYRVLEEVLEYKRRHDQFRACLAEHVDRKELGEDGTPAVCSACRPHLSWQAHQLELVSGAPLRPVVSSCADVEDMANVSSRLWRCRGCHVPPELTERRRWRPHAPTAVALLVVAVFYGAVAWWARRRRSPQPVGGGATEGSDRVRPPAEGELLPRLVRSRLPQPLRRRR